MRYKAIVANMNLPVFWKHTTTVLTGTVIAQALPILVYVANPLSYVFFVAGKQKIELVWQVVLFITTISVFLAPISLKQVLFNYTVAYSALYLIYLFLSYKFSKNSLPVGSRSGNSQSINGG